MPGLIVEEEAAKGRKLTKNERRRLKEKEAKKAAKDTTTQETLSVPESKPTVQEANSDSAAKPVTPTSTDPIQDVPAVEEEDIPLDDPLYDQFANIFEKFKHEDKADPSLTEPEKPEVFYDDDDNIQSEDEEQETKKRLSKKAKKAAGKLSIAELKAIVKRPEVVEWTDNSAQDPKLLVNIKSTRNVVPVPNHWSLKREYLSSKRGIEKASFALPKFLADTGISEMRDATLEKQAEASLKQKQRERVQPKMGKLNLDYNKMYDAFFRLQTKPHLTRYGEVYYEGKEYEINLRHLRPGDLSDELKEALNIPPGAPPPWLINMQKVGPPPSYPALKIPGLNAPPPPGASWGFHPGGYGKPPVDAQNKELWGGDVFGRGGETEDEKTKDGLFQADKQEVDKSLWGELLPNPEPDEDEDAEEDEDSENEDDEEEEVSASGPFGGMDTPSGITSTIPTDFGTHSMAEEFNLRKARRGTETEESHHPRSAGTRLQERSIRAEGMFGGERAYNLPSQQERSNVPMLGSEDRGKKRKAGDVDVSIDAEALERNGNLSKDEIRKQYEAQRTREGAGSWKGVVDQEDLSQMIAEESAKRQKRDAEREMKRR